MRFLIFLGVTLVLVAVMLVLVVIKVFYRRLRPGQALVVTSTGSKEQTVSFTGALVLPIVHRADLMDITVKTVEVMLQGREALVCKDHVKAAIKAVFYVKVNQTFEDVLRVAQGVGCERASDPLEVEALFRPKLIDGLRTVGHRLSFEDLQRNRTEFRDEVIQFIGCDLNGFVLDDAAIELIERAANAPAEEAGPFR
jgi:uncharacterized membrane protein YqiK